MVVIPLALAAPVACLAQTPVGLWKTIDDETGKLKSIVEITETEEGYLEGTVVEVLHSVMGPNPVCKKCPGEFKDKPVKGLTIMWDVPAEANDGTWGSGQILDPKKGKIYKVKLSLEEDGRLKVRGFIGFSLLGRTQHWIPLEE